MLNGILGKKVGMTQLFDEKGNVVPVTVVDVGTLFVTQVKTAERDGYTALQVGIPKKRAQKMAFSSDWLKAKKNFFAHIKEIKLDDAADYSAGQELAIANTSLSEGDKVSVTSDSRGLGFQGVVKRWGFGGGPGSHGSNFHRIPGAIGNMRTQGEVLKGTKLPGHMGAKQVTVAGLEIVRIDNESACLFIKGSIPGKKDTLIVVKK